jgi:type II secretion system protein C
MGQGIALHGRGQSELAASISRQWQDSQTLLAQYAPGLASLLLASLIVAECYRGVLSLLSGQPLFEANRSNEHHGSGQIDVQAIVRAHLFGMAENAAGSEPIRSTIDNLLLQGTVTTEAPTRGIAIISDAGAAKVLKVGDEIAGATLRSVYLDHINLNYGGQWVTLTLPLRQSSVKRSTSVEDVSPLIDDDSPQGISDLGDAIRASAAIDNESHQLRGFLIEPSNVRRAFFRFGLHEQDLVISVNGAPVAGENAERSQRILEAMLNSSQSVITVMRAGVPQDIVLDVALAGSRLAPPI